MPVRTRLVSDKLGWTVEKHRVLAAVFKAGVIVHGYNNACRTVGISLFGQSIEHLEM